MSTKNCYYCSNTGYVWDNEQCPTCRGSGMVAGYRCPACDNLGTVRKRKLCPHCTPGGSCFITTATITALNKGDKCLELETFRAFRDNYVAPNYPIDIQEYYAKAPSVVRAIDTAPDAEEIYIRLWVECLKPAYLFIVKGNYEEAYYLYKKTMQDLMSRFINS